MSQHVRFSFVAMEYWLLILNRTYKVFVTQEFVCGAKVRGAVPATWSRTGEVPIDGDLQSPECYIQAERLRKYDGVDVESRRFSSMSRANFQIHRDDLKRVRFNPKKKWGMGPYPHAGRIELHLRTGTVRELILLGDQDGRLIARRIQKGA